MKYYFAKVVDYSFEEAITKITEELKKVGFGVLFELDMKDKLKEKIDVDIKKYKILGACNPPNAYKALQAEANIGLLLPCNVVVRETADSKVEISAVNPVASMMAVENKNLSEVALPIKEKLEEAIRNV